MRIIELMLEPGVGRLSFSVCSSRAGDVCGENPASSSRRLGVFTPSAIAGQLPLGTLPRQYRGGYTRYIRR